MTLLKHFYQKKSNPLLILLLIIAATITPTISNAQHWMTQFGHLGNYYQIKAASEAYFNEDTSRMSNKAFNYKGFIRYVTFMEPRVDENGSLATYSQAFNTSRNEILNSTEDNRIFAEWKPLGPSYNTNMPVAMSKLGLITSVWVDTSNYSTIYAGSNSGGLFVTHNGGDNWSCLTDQYMVTGVQSIEKNARKPNVIYIGTGFYTWGKDYGVGVLKSTNNGSTWQSTGLDMNTFQNEPNFRDLNYVVLNTVQHPTQPDTLIALINFDLGRGAKLMRTYDGGDNWISKLSLPSDVTSRLFKIEMSPSNPAFMIACGRKIYKTYNYWDDSTDMTDMFLEPNERLERASISFHPTDPNKILVLIHKVTTDSSKIETKDILLSQDGGISFISIGETTVLSYIDFYKMEIEWSKVLDDTFYIGGLSIRGYRILPGNTLVDLGIPYNYHVDNRELKTYCKKTPNTSGGYTFEGLIYQGNDGGVTKGTEDIVKGVTWNDISGKGLNITQFYGIGIPKDKTDIIIGGSQDGNYCRYETEQWTIPYAGDAADVVFNYRHPDSVYMVTFMTGFYGMLSIDGGKTWPTSGTNSQNLITINDSRRSDAPIEMSISNPRRLYIGGKNVWRSLNGRDFVSISNFNSIFPLLFPSDLKVIREASNGTTIYAGLSSPYWTQVQKTRLFKTTNGGVNNNWIDITPTEPDTPTTPGCNLGNVGIFDIAVNPNNPDQFYLAVDRNIDGKKVFRYTAGVWINMSEGLPNVPVNCIRYYKGTNLNELFAGTDLGVYYRNDIINRWVPFGSGLPLVSVSDLEINYTTKEMVAATFGRGIYKINLCFDPHDLNTTNVEGTQTWGNKVLTNDVIIKPGAVLTITGIVEMPPARHIYVLVGGKLILNGGTITNACKNELWGGIVLHGTSSKPQNPLYQGLVDLFNQAVIENATIGIHCLNPPIKDGDVITPYTAGGGIIFATNASFLNNSVAVIFEPCITKLISRFSLCNFVTNDKLFADASFNYFVRMNEVNGVTIIGCSFKNEHSSLTIEHGKGIYCNNSGFTVDQYCSTPCLFPRISEFNNLQYGIYAVGKKGGRSFSIKNTEFNMNESGIYASAVDLMSIKSNKVFMKGNNPSVFKPEVASGIYLDKCSGYIIEENELWTTEVAAYFTTYGIYINSCGEANNTIYNNKFFDNTYGITSQDQNRNKDGSAGLLLKCNQFNNVKMDILVLKTEPLSAGMGIASTQGTNGINCEYPAGNLFTNPYPPVTGYFSIYNEGGPIVYTHHNISTNNRVRPSVVTESTVRREPTGFDYTESCCPAHTNGGGGVGTIDGVTLSYKSEAVSTTQSLTSLIDDGDTGEKVMDVNSAAPAEALLIRNNLLQTSPYVSDTVLKTAINREELLNNAMLRDIMVANPHSAKSETIMEELDMRLEPMPEYMKDEILEGVFVLSAKELMEAKRDMDMQLYNYGFNRLLSVSLTDTIPVAADTLMALLAADGSAESLMRQAWLLLENGDTTSALNRWSSISNEISLSEAELAELGQQQAFMHWLVENHSVDSLDIVPLNTFMLNSSTAVSAVARGLMVANGLLVYNEPYLEPDLTKSTEVGKQQVKPVNPEVASLKVYPNPAHDFITIEYSTSYDKVNIEIELFDESGRKVYNQNLIRKLDSIILDTRSFKSGSYIVKLVIDNKTAKSSKVLISK